jgi:hypothetical protein
MDKRILVVFINNMKGVLMNAINKILAVSAISAFAIIAYAVASAQPSSPTMQTPPSTTTAAPAMANSGGTGGDVSGTYKCSGYDPYDKTNYTENIVLKKNGDSTYNVQLIHSDSVVPYNLGTGVAMQGVNNAISYTYWDPQKPTVMGTEIFEVKPDGSLVGSWTSSGTNWVGTENCTKS